MSFIYDMSDSWNNAGTTFTAIKMNVTNSASATGSKLIDLQLAGTSFFNVDKSGNVGIGTASPTQKLHVVGNALVPINNSYFCYTTDYGFGTPDSNGLQLFAAGGDNIRFGHRSAGTFTERMRLDTSGNLGIGTTSIAGNATNRVIVSQGADSANFIVTKTGAQSGSLVAFDVGILVGSDTNHPLLFKTNATERMRLATNGNVGIGIASPSYKLVVSNGGASGIEFGPGYSGTDNLILSYNRSGAAYVNTAYDAAQHIFYTSSGEKMRIDASGNVGVGVTPKAWQAAPANTVQIGGAMAVTGYTTSGNRQANIWCNAYINTSGALTYMNTDAASAYRQLTGVHAWYSAPSGTADTALTFTQTMTLNASGNLAIGSTTANRAGASQGLSVEGSSTTVIEANRNGGRAGYMYVDSISTSVGEFRNLPLTFNTNDTERMRITSGGNVGIGTSSPSEKLTVVGPSTGAIADFSNGVNANFLIKTAAQLLTAGPSVQSALAFQTNSVERMRITAFGNVQVGTASLLTTATDGFPYIPTCAGTPTGTPTAITGYAPMVVDSTNNKLYVYVGGAWQAMN